MSYRNDLWERREVERQKFHKKLGRPRDLFDELQNYHKPLVLILCLILFMSSELPALLPNIRFSLSLISCITLLTYLMINKEIVSTPRYYLKNSVLVLVSLSFLWGVIQYFLSPDKMVALGELIRLFSGIFSFLMASLVLTTNKDRFFVILSLIACVSFVSIYDISRFSQKVGFHKHFSSSEISILGTHESVGSLLALLLPLSISFSISTAFSHRIKMGAQAGSLILGFAWIMVRCRSAWIGGSIGLLIMTFLIWKFVRRDDDSKQKRAKNRIQNLLASPTLWMVLGLSLIIFLGGILPIISHRAGTLLNLLDDSSLATRFVSWKGGIRMLSEKPLLGWGLGSFLLLQGYWTNLGDGPEQVILHGTGHQNIAHNYYIQWAAETGVIGLFLFLVSLSVLFLTGYRSLFLVKNAQNKSIIIACLAALCGGMIEVGGSPAFQFCGVWSIFWTIAGILFAQISIVDQEIPCKISIRSVIVIFSLALLTCIGAIWYGKKLLDPLGQPRGIFQIVEQTQEPYHPGDLVRWRALYRNGYGIDEGSSPASRWVDPVWLEQGSSASPQVVKSREWALIRVPFIPGDTHRGFSDLSLRLPPGETGVIQVQAVFRDEFGRSYQASRVIDVTKK